MNSIKFSKKGDQGETSLLTGGRVSKASLRPETFGTIDEANSALGIAKAFTKNKKIREMIENVQEDLKTLGAELASEGRSKKVYYIDSNRTLVLERWIEELQKEVFLPRHFIQPGANAVSAIIDLSRTIIRRAERRAVAMKEEGLLDHSEASTYLNRLADFLFSLARYSEKKE